MVVVELSNPSTNAFEALAFEHVLVDKPLDPDLCVLGSVVLLTLVDPLLKSHDLIQTIYICSEAVYRSVHEPVSSHVAKILNHPHNERTTNQDYNDAS